MRGSVDIILFMLILAVVVIVIAVAIIRAILSIGPRVDLLKEIAANTKWIAEAMEGGKSPPKKPKPPPEGKPPENMEVCRKCGKPLDRKQMYKLQKGGYMCDQCRREILGKGPSVG